MNEPTQEYLKECFDYVDGKLYWKERPRHHFKREQDWKTWNKNWSGEIACQKPREDKRYRVKIDGKKYYRQRIVYIINFGAIKNGMQIDHIDGNTLNDKIENLRQVTPEQNSRNCKKQSNNNSGVTGVFYNKKYKIWTAFYRENKETKFLYKGKDFFEAVCARKSWENKSKTISPRHGR